MAETNRSDVLEYSEYKPDDAAAFVMRCYNSWLEHFKSYEQDKAETNWRHFRNESEDLEDKKTKNAKKDRLTSTYYNPVICPAVLTRVAVFNDVIAQQDPLVRFVPEDGADVERVRKQETIVNHWLEKDDFFVKQIERITIQEIFPYSVVKCYIKETTKNEYVPIDPDETITLQDGTSVTVQNLQDSYKLQNGESIPDEVLDEYLPRSRRFRKKVTSQRPTHENVPHGRFVHDPTKKDSEFWRFAGDVQLVPLTWLMEHRHQFDAEKIEKLYKSMQDHEDTVSEFDDMHYRVTDYDDNARDPQQEAHYFALIELYAKLIEKGEVKIKRFYAILNAKDALNASGKNNEAFLIKDPEDSPWVLFDFPYAMSWSYKVPHSTMGIPTAELGADLADAVNDMTNLTVDQMRWSLLRPILMRQGVRIKGNFSVTPGRVNQLSDISERTIRTLDVSSGHPGNVSEGLTMFQEQARTNMAASDVLQGVTPDPEEKLGSLKLRRESGVTRMNLTGMFIGRQIMEIALMFRDLGAQIMTGGQEIYVGGKKVDLTAHDLTERSSVKMVNLMRLASQTETQIKAKEIHASIIENPMTQAAVQEGDFKIVWESTKRWLVAMREKDPEGLIGKEPPALPAPIPEGQGTSPQM